jgi:hypothetical protein
MLDILTQSSLGAEDFNQQIEWVIPNFIAKRMITMIYADGGNGKSWLGLAVAKHCAISGMEVAFLDFDNPLSILKERGVHEKLVQGFPKLNYLHRSKCPVEPFELLRQIAAEAVSGKFNNMMFIIDSLRNFADVGNDAKTMLALNYLMDIREAGATIIVLHHSNKDGKNYQGSNNIRNSVDNMFQLHKLEMSQEIGVLLKVKKERAAVLDCAYDISPDSLDMVEEDIIEAQATESDLVFIQQVKAILLATPGANKTAVLEATGTTKDDKTARGKLDKYDGLYWQSKRQHTRITYTLID